jgi:ribosomal protein S18 acetylase RimI-like enzyme
MIVEVTEEPISVLSLYAGVPITFTVESILEVTTRNDRPISFPLSERQLDVPYEKNCDAIAGEGPLQWACHFNLSKWALFVARSETRLVGGAAVAFDTPGMTLLEGRQDLAVLWDIRVLADVRRQGVGRTMLENVEAWARLRGCRQLKIETQNTNVPACRFYERRGYQLHAIRHNVYPAFPEEIQLLWSKNL